MNDIGQRASELFQGGPPSRLLRVLGLGPAANITRRVVLAVLIGWLPLVVLAVANEGASGIFLSSVGVHFRYVFAVSLLIFADAACGLRLGAIARHFIDSGLVPEQQFEDYENALASTRRLRDSAVAESVVIIGACAMVAAFVWSVPLAALSAWHKSAASGYGAFSAAGWWHALVSLPLLGMLILGWVWRLFLWTRFLWLMSRIELRLVAAHPDKAAGLGFVAYSLRAWSILGLAIGAIVAGMVTNGVLVKGMPLHAFRYEIGGTVALVVAAFTAPLFTFTRTLLQEWRRGVFEYGALADGFGRQFEYRWLRREQPMDDSVLEQPDFSAATDLYQVVDRVREMRHIPIDLKSVLVLVVATLMPFVPAVLIALPLDVIFETLGKVLL